MEKVNDSFHFDEIASAMNQENKSNSNTVSILLLYIKKITKFSIDS